jgi:hypothetical protein
VAAYALYVLVGTLLWQSFVEALGSPLTQLSGACEMVARVNFPTRGSLARGPRTAYVLILVLGMPAERALQLLVALIVPSMSLAGYAHVLNDLFDIGSDHLAGKVNRVARMSPWQRPALLAGLAGMGAVPWLWVPLTPMAAVALGASTYCSSCTLFLLFD